MGRLGLLLQPHSPSGLSGHPHSDQFSVLSTFLDSRVLNVSHTWLAFKNYGPHATFLASLVLCSLSQMTRKVTCMDVWAAKCTIPRASIIHDCHGNSTPEPCNVATGVAREEIMSYTTLHPWKKNGHTDKDSWTDPFVSATKYSVHWVWQAQGHSVQWLERNP